MQYEIRDGSLYWFIKNDQFIANVNVLAGDEAVDFALRQPHPVFLGSGPQAITAL